LDSIVRQIWLTVFIGSDTGNCVGVAVEVGRVVGVGGIEVTVAVAVPVATGDGDRTASEGSVISDEGDTGVGDS
jgi:hypothetical protein